MREIAIKTEPFEFIEIHKLHMDMKAGSHAVAVVKGSIKSADYESYSDILKEKEVWIQIKVMEDYEQEEKQLFWGIMTEYELERKGGEFILTLEITDGTILMDEQEHIRVFQDIEETYRDIFNVISEAYPRNGIISPVDSRKRLGKLYVQYGETDWQFACRMAAELHTFLVPDVYTGGVKYYVGLPKRKTVPMPEVLSHIVRKGKRDGHVIQSREIYELGESFEIDGQIQYIFQIRSEYMNGELIHTYQLTNLRDLHIPSYVNRRIAGGSLMAEVTDVQMDQVKIKISSDEYGRCRFMWFPYSTIYSSPDGTGWYCMPEKGDMVRLHFPDSLENHSYVISAVHSKSDGARTTPSHKSFKTSHGKEILFTPEKIEITNNKGSRIVLSDEDGILMETDKTINMNAAGNILVTTKAGDLTMKTTQMLKLKQNDTVLKLDEDILLGGGELRIQ